MNPFSGSTILWSILGEYEPCNVLCWSCKGLLSGSYGPIIAKLPDRRLEHISLISTSRKLEVDRFSGSMNLWRFLGEYEPIVLFFGSVQGL